MLLACHAGGELIAAPIIGGVADRIGRRPVLLVSTSGVVGCSFLLLCSSHGIVAAAISLLVMGVFESVLHPRAATVLVDVAPGPALRDHFALTTVASNAGGVIGPALGAALVRQSLGLVFIGAAAAQLPLLIFAVSLLALSQMLAGPVTQAMPSDLAPANGRTTHTAAYSAVNDIRDASRSGPGSRPLRCGCEPAVARRIADHPGGDAGAGTRRASEAEPSPHFGNLDHWRDTRC